MTSHDATHRIRLRGPWGIAFAEATDLSASVFVRCDFPAQLPDLLPPSGPVSVVLRRRFNRPTGLDELSCVAVRMEQMAIAHAQLNGQAIVVDRLDHSIQQSDVSRQMLPNNELVLVWPIDDCQLVRSSLSDVAVTLLIGTT